MEKYICKECGAEVIVKGAEKKRTCEHTGTILLDISLKCTGDGGADAQI